VRNEHVRSIDVAEDQNTARDPRRLEFVEAVCVNGQMPCVACVAMDNDDLCERLPCGELKRKDGRNGYFREEVRG
jgi:hypothetical protein